MQKNIRVTETSERLRKLFRILIELCNCRMAELGRRLRRSVDHKKLGSRTADRPMSM
jgi:hypothetical protein